MFNYIIKKITYSVLVLWGVLSLVFFLFNILPGDPARMMLDKREDSIQLEVIKKKYAFDRSISQQYFLYLNDVLPLSIHHHDNTSFTSLESGKYHYVSFFSTSDYNKNPKLAIYGYESTGFLNRIAYNMPTISFYNFKNSNLRKNVIKNYINLVSTNFLFISPFKAAKFLKNTNFDINRWWFNKKAQTKLNNFKKIYTRVSNNNLEELFKFIST